MKLPTKPPTRQQRHAEIAKEPLGEFFAWHKEIKRAEIAELRRIVELAVSERPIQLFLQAKPALLVRHLGGGHGRWVIPQKRLGAEHVTDFLIGDAHSFGRDWYAVELESPRANMFTKAGNPSATLSHAIRQIHDWRNWLTENLGYAKRPRSESGLGLKDIHPELAGYVIIGRRSATPESTNALRRRMMREHRLEIHSYDWLLDAAGGHVDWFGTELGKCERQRRSPKRRR